MDGQEYSTVALADVGSLESFFVECTLAFHGIQHRDERVVGLLDLTPANRRQLERIVLKDVRLGSVNLTTEFASKVLFRLTILD